MPRPRPVIIRSREYGLPYSKGVMTQSLAMAGIPPERGHLVATRIERRLQDEIAGGTEIDVDELHAVAAQVLAEEEGEGAATRFRRWAIIRRLDIPIIMLIGGTAGSGKSTVAQQVAARLGITRVSSTDMVRQVMRAFFSPKLMPVLHHSSFDVPADGLLLPGEHERGMVGLIGFLEQSRQVSVGVNAILERAERERTSTLIEGVHLVPGLAGQVDHGRSAVVEAVVRIEDEAMHRSLFSMRDMQTEGARPMQHYLRHFGTIREIQGHLVEQAERRGVRVFENTYIDDTVLALVDHALDTVEQVASDLEDRPG